MFVILFFIFLSINLIFCSQITCGQSEEDDECFVENIIVDNSNSHFNLLATTPSTILKIIIKKSSIPVLTAGICDTFANLNELNLINCEIKTIEENTFNSCRNLQILRMNNIKQLTDIKPKTFHSLRSLTELTIYGTPLVIFDADLIRGLTNLRKLQLENNQIFEIDEVKLLKNSPNLEIFWIQSKNFLCGTSENINATMRKINPKIKVQFSSFRCLNKDQWTRAFNKIDEESQKTIVNLILDSPTKNIFNYLNLELVDKENLKIIILSAETKESDSSATDENEEDCIETRFGQFKRCNKPVKNKHFE